MNMLKRFFVVTALIFVLCETAQATGKLPPMARQALYNAQVFSKDGQHAKAAAVIEAYVKTAEDDIHEQVYLSLGSALYQAGEKETGLEAFREGFTAYPQNAYLCMNIGIILYELERFAEAGGYLEKAHDLEKPSNPEVLYQAGTAYFLGDDFRNCARVMEGLVKRTQQPPKEWVKLALHALMESHQFVKAQRMLIKFLESNPEEAAYWRLLAKLHLDQERYLQAAAALEVSFKLEAPSSNELEQLAGLYLYPGARLMAARTLERAYGASPTREQARKVAVLYASAARTDKAVRYLDAYTQDPALGLTRGKMLFSARRFSEAAKEFSGLLETRSAPEARFYLALCAVEKRNWEQARKELNSLVGLKSFTHRISGYQAALQDLELAKQEASF